MPGPKLFHADERCLGGRQLLQQQHLNMVSRLHDVRPHLDTVRTHSEVCVKNMLKRGWERAGRLRQAPYCSKVPIYKRNHLSSVVDNHPPNHFSVVWEMDINKGLREKKTKNVCVKTHTTPVSYGPNAVHRGNALSYYQQRQEDLAERYSTVRRRRLQRLRYGMPVDGGEEAKFKLSPKLKRIAEKVLSRMPLPRPTTAPVYCTSESIHHPIRPCTAPPTHRRPQPHSPAPSPGTSVLDSEDDFGYATL
eukprot:TRINITY_DN5974_c2_g1_i1.p1 TRINITY_DN5974_c2_g1~~TRINITY_DN5974_c2_g1_i1.p1  ORF type:complete len:249 (+),score=9.13 TRINITY_DN5974_c2_g1_i1:40-786(+)